MNEYIEKDKMKYNGIKQNKIYKICYQETQTNGNKYMLFGAVNSCLLNFVTFQGKYPC